MYVLNNGKWYQIEDNFSRKVFDSYEEIRNISAGVTLPPCNQGEHENKYNERVARELDKMCNMDRKTISHGGRNQKIEFCDLFSKNKKLIHVKHYGASSVLSHLFYQGLVSGELFLFDEEFRRKLNGKLPRGYKLNNPEQRPKPSDYEIIFSIISKYDADLDIPFFSKVSIRSARKRLTGFGYSVSLLKISLQ